MKSKVPFSRGVLLPSALLCATSLVSTARAQAITNSDPSVPIVTLQATDPTASEAGDPGKFTVWRAGPTNVALYVFCLAGGTAANGWDYLALPSWVTMPRGVRSVDIPFQPLDDRLVEGAETVVLRLVYPPIMVPGGAPINYLIGSPAEAVVVIQDNDLALTNRPPIVRILTPTNGSAFVAPANIPLTASASDTDGYVATVEFFANTRSLGITTNNPRSTTPGNPFQLVWSNAPAGPFVLTAKATDNGGAVTWSDLVAITVNPPPATQPVVTIRATDPYASEPCTAANALDTGRFTVSRSLGTNLELRVFYAVSGTASNGVDYSTLSGQVVIPKGAWSADILIAPRLDSLMEGTETVVLRVEPPICVALWPPPPDCYLVGQPAEALVFIRECIPTNRPPVVLLTWPPAGATFRAPAIVGILADTVDADGYVGKVEFFAGTNKLGEQSKFFFIPPPPGQPIPYEITWSNMPPGRYVLTAKATDDRGATALSPPVPIMVLTNPSPPVPNLPPVVTLTATDPVAIEGTNCWGWPTVTNRWPASFVTCTGMLPNGGTPIWWFTNCGPKNATLTLRRAGDTNAPLVVNYAIGGTATNGVDYDRLPGVATIAAGERKTDILIVPREDHHPDPVKTVVLRLLPAPVISNATPPYVIGCPNAAAAVIVDSDRPRLVTGALPDRLFHLGTAAPDNAWYRVECSTDLVTWVPVCTNLSIQGTVHFVDPDSPSAPQRFYRTAPTDPPPTE
jgi:hypothetical protein